jgi:hypothetical protein
MDAPISRITSTKKSSITTILVKVVIITFTVEVDLLFAYIINRKFTFVIVGAVVDMCIIVLIASDISLPTPHECILTASSHTMTANASGKTAKSVAESKNSRVAL